MGRPPGSAAWGTVLQYECGVCLGDRVTPIALLVGGCGCRHRARL